MKEKFIVAAYFTEVSVSHPNFSLSLNLIKTNLLVPAYFQTSCVKLININTLVVSKRFISSVIRVAFCARKHNGSM